MINKVTIIDTESCWSLLVIHYVPQLYVNTLCVQETINYSHTLVKDKLIYHYFCFGLYVLLQQHGATSACLVIMDWRQCIICSKKGGDLKCPAKSLQNNGLEVYEKFLNNVAEFKQLGHLPVEVDFKTEGNASTFLEKEAKWHKSCHLKFASSKLTRIKELAIKKRKQEDEDQRTSKRSARQSHDKESCIFCSEMAGKLHECATMNIGDELRKMATELHDSNLLAKVSSGDVVAIEAKYHFECLSKYRNKHRALQRSISSMQSEKDDVLQVQAIVFAELVDFIECQVAAGQFIFKLAELHTIFQTRLRSIGHEVSINKSRLKNKLLDRFTGKCQEQSDGKNTLFVFNKGLQDLLKEEDKNRNFDIEAREMTRVVKMIRKDILDWNGFTFDGSFPEDCQQNSIPPSLKALVGQLLYGPNIKTHSFVKNQEALSIAQQANSKCIKTC